MKAQQLLLAAILTAALGSSIAASGEEKPVLQNANPAADRLPVEGEFPSLAGAAGWLNSPPLTPAGLRGKVVLVDFWTYSCINSLRNLPYVQAWAAKYKDAGLIVIGAHSPEFGFEKDPANVEMAVRDLKLTYPVAIDSNHGIWQAFGNEYWPADYLIDGKGRVRYHHYGEGDYAESERIIQQLLRENGATGLNANIGPISAPGIEAPPGDDEQSPETYVGSAHGGGFASPFPPDPALNQWGSSGAWNIGAESALLTAAPGRLLFRFHSRDLHLVLGLAKDARPVHFRVTLDGSPPGSDHGVDSAPDGTGEVREPRLYQLVRQKGQIRDRTFEIEFLDPGVRAYVFTFG